MAQALPTAFSESMSMRSIREPDCPVSRLRSASRFSSSPRKFAGGCVAGPVGRASRGGTRVVAERLGPCISRHGYGTKKYFAIDHVHQQRRSGGEFQSVSITGANSGDFEESDNCVSTVCAAAEAFVHHLRDLRADERGLEPGHAERDGQRSGQSATVWVERSGDCAAHADARGCAESCRHF